MQSWLCLPMCSFPWPASSAPPPSPLTICQSFFLRPPCSLCLIWQPPFVLLFSSSSFCRYIKLTKRIAHWWDCWPVYRERDENQQNNNSTLVNIWEFTKHTYIVSFDFYKTSKNSNNNNRGGIIMPNECTDIEYKRLVLDLITGKISSFSYIALSPCHLKKGLLKLLRFLILLKCSSFRF